MTQTSTQVLQQGLRALRVASASIAVPATDAGLFWLLGQAYLESGLGFGDMSHMPSAPHFANTNNWGAIYWPSATQAPNPYSDHWVPGRDAEPGGQTFIPKIAAYPTQEDGARGFLYLYKRYGQDVLEPLARAGATPTDLARGLYKHGYFSGCHVGLDGAPSLNRGTVLLKNAQALQAKIDADPNAMVSCAGRRKASSLLHATQAEADAANIGEYAQMIANGANLARKANAAPPEPVPEVPSKPAEIGPLGPAAQTVASRVGSVAATAAGLGTVGAVGYYLWDKFFR